MSGLYRISEEPLNLNEAVAAVGGADRGAIAIFVGVVRDHHSGRRVQRLEYDAYREMALEVLRSIGGEIAERFGTPHVAILHRVGRLSIGEASVVVAIGAAHRKEALAACAHAIERVKRSAPIWKKEYYEGGVTWIEGPEAP